MLGVMILKYKNYQVIGAVFTVLLGTLLNFLYKWLGENPFVGTFSAVNESTWEHLKLIFVPMLLFSVYEYFKYGKNILNFIPVKVISILLGMLGVVVSFYTYVGIIGKHYMVADVATFIVGVVIAYIFSNKMLESRHFQSEKAKVISLIILTALIIMFIVFTFNPPEIALFKDPETGGYGIQ